MTYALLSGGNGHTFFGGASGGGTTPAIDTTGADLIVLGIVSSAGFAAPTDNKGNTWTPRTSQSSSQQRVQLYYCHNPTVGAGHTFTSTGSFEGIYVEAFSGSAASPYDQESGATSGAGGLHTIQPGSITPAEDNELFVVMCGNESAIGFTQTIDQSFTITDQFNLSSPTWGAGMAYLIQGSAAARNPTWTQSGSGTICIVMATFKTAPVASSSPPGAQLMAN